MESNNIRRDKSNVPQQKDDGPDAGYLDAISVRDSFGDMKRQEKRVTFKDTRDDRASFQPKSKQTFSKSLTQSHGARQNGHLPRTPLEIQDLAPTDGSQTTKERQRRHAQEIVDQLAMLLYSAILHGELDSVKEIYKYRRVVFVDKELNTPLHVSAKRGQLSILRWLLKYSYIPVSMKNDSKETCCHLAAKHGHFKCLKAAVSSKTATPLTLMCDKDNQGMTVLHYAAILGRDDMVTWLADDFGKTLCYTKNHEGQTPLHFASARGHPKCVQILAKAGKVSVDIKDKTGATAAFYAAQEGRLDCLQALRHVTKCDLGLANNQGHSPLHVAAQAGHLEVVQFLVNHTDTPDLSARAKDGATVFHLAAANGHAETIRYILTLEGAGEAVRMRDVRGNSAAHDAAEHGHMDCLKLMIDAGLDIYLRDELGDTPYSLALRSSSTECAMYVKSLTGGEVVDPDSVMGAIRSTLASDNVPNMVGDAISSRSVARLKRIGIGSKKRSKKIKESSKPSRDTFKSSSSGGETVQGEFILRDPQHGRQNRVFTRTQPTLQTVALLAEDAVTSSSKESGHEDASTSEDDSSHGAHTSNYQPRTYRAMYKKNCKTNGYQSSLKRSDIQIETALPPNQQENRAVTKDLRLTRKAWFADVSAFERVIDKKARSTTEVLNPRNENLLQTKGEEGRERLNVQGKVGNVSMVTIKVPPPPREPAPTTPRREQQEQHNHSMHYRTDIPATKSRASDTDHIYMDVTDSYTTRDQLPTHPPPLPPTRQGAAVFVAHDDEDFRDPVYQESYSSSIPSTNFTKDSCKSHDDVTCERINVYPQSDLRLRNPGASDKDSQTGLSTPFTVPKETSPTHTDVPEPPPPPPILHPVKSYPLIKRLHRSGNHARSKSFGVREKPQDADNTAVEEGSLPGAPACAPKIAKIRDMLDRSGIIASCYNKFKSEAAKRGDFMDSENQTADPASGLAHRHAQPALLSSHNEAHHGFYHGFSKNDSNAHENNDAGTSTRSAKALQRKESFRIKYSEDAMQSLSASLSNRAQGGSVLPDPRSGKLYEFNPDPPAELEIFFKKRRGTEF